VEKGTVYLMEERKTKGTLAGFLTPAKRVELQEPLILATHAS
jgi:hypothetical protein